METIEIRFFTKEVAEAFAKRYFVDGSVPFRIKGKLLILDYNDTLMRDNEYKIAAYWFNECAHIFIDR
jgi:hypothetical protein